MKWLKRLVRYLFQDEEREQPIREESPKRERKSPDLDVRVTYQYPTGKFRFPIIPDESLPQREKGARATYENERTTIDDSPEERRPFRPSEVPSPIYGYKERPRHEPTLEERAVSQQSDVLVDKEEQRLIDLSLNEEQQPAEQVSISWGEQEIEEYEARQEEQAITEHAQPLETERVFQEAGYQEETAISLVETEEQQTAPVEPREQKKEAISTELPRENKEGGKREASVSVKPTSPRIPYNVMMLKQDRKKWEERKKREEKACGYRFPSIELLQPPFEQQGDDRQWIEKQREQLNETFKNFNVGAKVVHVTQGPTVTRFEVQPAPGVKVNKITSLSDDIKLSLAAKDIRIEAPIPGKSTIGIEVPNAKSRPVFIREILQSEEFRASTSPLTVALGLDLSGAPIVTDLKKMPHGLIAGATGSGKSVCINAMLVSLLYKAAPHEVKLLLIDPKMVELAPYNHIPHLVSPVITDVKAATGALKWAVEEMERRYELFAHAGVRDIQKYNELVKKEETPEHYLPYIVIVIDELADLMMVAPADVEEAICRIAQKARACGIHLIVATQRPSVDVITGLIKANIPTRIAFSVSSQIDSRTIIDTNGAEKLLGRGDMLFLENGTSKTVRIQGNFVSDEEIERVVTHVKAQMSPSYLFEQDDFLKQSPLSNDGDELFYEACEFVVQQGGASTSSLQRRFRIGYNRAARLIEMMEEQGIISEARGSKPRDVLITEEELANLQETSMM
ncbi:DNA translocase FtsK [Anoxybacteroides tepidamans]|uniref:DNA translocase FtsK n=1 Tax=Anoxybacteroides tepidamans TaxID=265948 RepID=UPI000489C67C|nr:DNA translocase FtsK [Anoxybacillus tepidamans]